MSGGVDYRVGCFSGEWVDLGGARLLLYRLERWVPMGPPPAPGVGDPGSSLDVEKLLGALSALRGHPDVLKLKSECDLALVELRPGSMQVYYLVSGRRLRCVPLALVPDAVRSVELLLRGPDSALVEVDPLQRSMLTRVRRELVEGLYASCLVGEVTDPRIVALGVELLNYGLRIVTAEELARTSIAREPVRRRRARRKKRARRRG